MLTLAPFQRGVTQCAAIPTTYPTFFASLKPENTIILVSPLRRTLQTMLLGFSSLLPSSTSHPVPLLILPQLQECGAYPCDIGGPLEETKARFPHEWLDWSEVEKNPEWNQNKGIFEATEAKNVARARWVRKFIRERKEENVVVVSHHGLLRRIVKAPHAHDRKKSVRPCRPFDRAHAWLTRRSHRSRSNGTTRRCANTSLPTRRARTTKPTSSAWPTSFSRP